MRDFIIGDEDDYISEEDKIELLNAFAVITRGVLETIRQWTQIRDQHGNAETLKSRFMKFA